NSKTPAASGMKSPAHPTAAALFSVVSPTTSINRGQTGRSPSPRSIRRALFLFRLRRLRRSHADDFEQTIARLRFGAVPVNLPRMIHHVASGRHRVGHIRIVMRPCPHPPRPGDHPDVPLFTMKVRTAHVSRVPLDELD